MVFFIVRPRETQTENNGDINMETENENVDGNAEMATREFEIPGESSSTKPKPKRIVKHYTYDFSENYPDAKKEFDDLKNQIDVLTEQLRIKKEELETFKNKSELTEDQYKQLKSATRTKKPAAPQLTEEEKEAVRLQKEADKEAQRLQREADKDAQRLLDQQEKLKQAEDKKRKELEDYNIAIQKWRDAQNEANDLTVAIKEKNEQLKEKENEINGVKTTINSKKTKQKPTITDEEYLSELEGERDNIKTSIEDEDKKIKNLLSLVKPEKPGGKEIEATDENAIKYPVLSRDRDVQYIIKTFLWQEKTKKFLDPIPMNNSQEIFDASDKHGFKAIQFMKIFFKAAMSGTEAEKVITPLQGLTEDDAEKKIKQFWFKSGSRLNNNIMEDKVLINTNTLVKLYMLAFKTDDPPVVDVENLIFKRFAIKIFLRDYFQQNPITEISDEDCWNICSAQEKLDILLAVSNKPVRVKKDKPSVAPDNNQNPSQSVIPPVVPNNKPKNVPKRPNPDSSKSPFEILKKKWDSLPESDKTKEKARLYLHAAARFYNFTECTKNLEDDSIDKDTKKKDINTSDGVWKKGIVSGQKFFFGEQNTGGALGNKNDERLLFFANLYSIGECDLLKEDLFSVNENDNLKSRKRMFNLFGDIFAEKNPSYGTREETEVEFPELTDLVTTKMAKKNNGQSSTTAQQTSSNFNIREMAIRAARAKLIGL